VEDAETEWIAVAIPGGEELGVPKRSEEAFESFSPFVLFPLSTSDLSILSLLKVGST
jgi:hypothetical protein